jgi:hypothetical protein
MSNIEDLEVESLLTDIKKMHSNVIQKSKYSRTKCMDCNNKPDVEVRWAEGMGHSWFCGACLERHKKEDIKPLSLGKNIDIERKLPANEASKYWKDGPPRLSENSEDIMKQSDNRLSITKMHNSLASLEVKLQRKMINETEKTKIIDCIQRFFEKADSDFLVSQFLLGYKQLSLIGKDLPDTHVENLYELASSINELKDFKKSLLNDSRLEKAIYVDSIAHELHTLSKQHEPVLYPILDQLAAISKEIGEQNREDRLLFLNKSEPQDISALNSVEFFNKSLPFEDGKSYWKLAVKAIKHGVSELEDDELVLLREWLYSKV